MNRSRLTALVAALAALALAGTVLVSAPAVAGAWHRWSLADEDPEVLSRPVQIREQLRFDGYCVLLAVDGAALVTVRHHGSSPVLWSRPSFEPQRVELSVHEACPAGTDAGPPPDEVQSVELLLRMSQGGSPDVLRSWKVRARDLASQPAVSEYGGFRRGWPASGVSGTGLLHEDSTICLRPEVGVTVYTAQGGGGASYSSGRAVHPLCLRPLDAVG
jgi:hypothetical protein